jgi:hypothetical protein
MKEAFSKFEVVRYLNFFATRQALWPPNPKELLAMALTSISRGLLGT